MKLFSVYIFSITNENVRTITQKKWYDKIKISLSYRTIPTINNNYIFSATIVSTILLINKA